MSPDKKESKRTSDETMSETKIVLRLGSEGSGKKKLIVQERREGNAEKQSTK